MRALLSVYDKTGIAELAARFHKLDVELVSSGGTAAAIAETETPVTDVAEFTGFPAMLGHRVVTLHPRVHGGILADRRDTSHLRDLETHNIDLVDIVVANLYPFQAKPSIEMIDIGGPAMVRAAAKNYEYVTVIVDPADYDRVIEEIAASGKTSPALRLELARKAFAHTAAYDAAIVQWFNSGVITREAPLPDTLPVNLKLKQHLRYGENPHQAGARYSEVDKPSWWDSVVQHSGRDLSYLNIFDADAAWTLVHDLGDGPAAAIIKHANPCGAATAGDLASAYGAAYACDERSAFGGIVALNRIVDLQTVALIEENANADLIVAPGYEKGAIDRLKAKRASTAILSAPNAKASPLTVRQLSDSFLVQQRPSFSSQADDWTIVTDRQPTDQEMADAELAWRVCAHVTSNAIVLAKDGVAWGIGAGQQNRVESSEIAMRKADGRAKGGACASDAFFPFADGLEVAAASGAEVVIQPGGSVNDDEVIEAANKLGISMIFTSERQFKH